MNIFYSISMGANGYDVEHLGQLASHKINSVGLKFQSFDGRHL